jgi:hypothetical protein
MGFRIFQEIIRLIPFQSALTTRTEVILHEEKYQGKFLTAGLVLRGLKLVALRLYMHVY